MTTDQIEIPKRQSALQWVRVSDTNPFEWSTSAPVFDPLKLSDSQVLIQNHAVSLNLVDLKVTTSSFLNTHTILPAVTGYDVSGRIVAIGKGVKDFKVGDDVFGFLNMNSSNGGGALQQYSVGEVDGLVKKPASISHEDAAALSIGFLSAMVCHMYSLIVSILV
jgi:NADPH:quinone reductase-like Zn-dependent oxidoreductase